MWKPYPRHAAPGDDFSNANTPHDQSDHETLKNQTPWNSLTARVISLVSRKGGVGKTTSAVNTGAALALSGHTVLIVSVDPQCGVSRSLGYGREELQNGLTEIFTNGTSLTDLAQTTPLKNLFFVSPNIWSFDQEEEFLDLMDREADSFVNEIDRARNLYDTILIDCPPNLGSSTRAALLASDSYLIPIQAEELCRDSLERLLNFIESFQSESVAGTGPQAVAGSQETEPILEGMFLTMVSERTRMSRHVMSKVNEDYADFVFQSSIPRAIRLTEMALRGKPAVIYDRMSAGSRAYFDLADELLTRHLQRNNGTRDHDVASQDVIAETVAMSEILTPGINENESPELISLDEVLAEEEKNADKIDEWENNWSTSSRYRDKLN